MNIGRTIRVFRTEPVLSPLPGDAPEAAPGADEILTEPPVDVELAPAAPPVRVGG